MNRIKEAVGEEIRLANNDRKSLLLRFEKELKKWQMFKFSILQAMVVSYAYATSAIVSKRILEFNMKPRIVHLCHFEGARDFLKENSILSWRVEAPPAQRLINKFCLLEENKLKTLRPSLALITALFATFCDKFPFEAKYEPHFELKTLVIGSGVAVGDENDLGKEVNEATYRQNHVPTNPMDDDQFEVEKPEVYGDLFGSADEATTDN
ncbi:hypothetical protein ABG067_007695, partial [Albugo candida]